MEKYTYTGKNLDELKTNAYQELNLEENECLIKVTEDKGSLFKGQSYTLDVYKITDVAAEIKNYLSELLTKMGLETTFETKIRGEQITIKMFSNQNNILIGRNGQTLKALQQIIRQYIFNIIGVYPYILLDVENYKEKCENHLEKLAKQIAREVTKTKQPIIMDSMNSYERRIVHNTLANFKNITTFSEGEEPNRHIVVKIKED
ncbi:single-stranded nucleic acid binding protein [Coprobacillus sp. CAG:605]|nr:single-stranded nucleic acid binding protein [Coprobacillus sp. CAG:605]